MRDGVQTASIYPFSTQKIFAPLPFCKWLVMLMNGSFATEISSFTGS